MILAAMFSLWRATLLAIVCSIFFSAEAATPSSGRWSSVFPSAPGPDGDIHDMQVHNGHLYICGTFQNIQNVRAPGIAKFDGQTWTSLGEGITGHPTVMLFDGDDVYVAGSIHTAGGMPVNLIARWDGTRWRALGGGISRQNGDMYGSVFINALFMQNGLLYVGGAFSKAGEVPVANIAMWDGLAWHGLGEGLRLPEDTGFWGTVDAISGDGVSIYAGGRFNRAGDVDARHIARWDGSRWENIGDIFDGDDEWIWHGEELSGKVDSLLFHDGRLFVAGDFRRVNESPAHGLAIWRQDTGWAGGGLSAGTPLFRGRLFVENRSLYLIGGSRFGNGERLLSPNVATGVWEPIEFPSVQGFLAGIRAFNATRYIAGQFSLIDGVSARSIARQVDGNWAPLWPGHGNGVSGAVGRICSDGLNIYVSGFFESAGAVPTVNLAKWDGISWSPFPGPGYFPPYIAFAHGELFSVVDNLEQWTGTQWATPPNSPPFARVFQIFLVGGDLYVMGHDNTRTLRYKWDGATWSELPAAFAEMGWQLHTDGEFLYSQNRDLIYRWNGSEAIPLGVTGPPGALQALARKNGELCVAIEHPYPDSSFALYAFDGAEWRTVRRFAQGQFVHAMASAGGRLFVAGWFSNVDGISLNSIAELDGNELRPLGRGLPAGGVNTMIGSGNDLIIGGGFERAGDRSSHNIAIWTVLPEVRLREFSRESENSIRFRISGPSGMRIEIQVATDLENWRRLEEKTLTGENDEFQTATTGGDALFFRAALLP